jgi:hypothetical protein
MTKGISLFWLRKKTQNINSYFFLNQYHKKNPPNYFHRFNEPYLQ